ncbi:MAG: hypothetical protein JWL76_1812 [Thermoleophilia bacterium]|nr:hypothetical protein [Thermoleophilia bacterium]
MSVSSTPTTSNAAASDRLSRAISAAKPSTPAAAAPSPATKPSGAKAAPDAAAPLTPEDLVAPASRTTTSSSSRAISATGTSSTPILDAIRAAAATKSTTGAGSTTGTGRGAKAAPESAAAGASQVMGAGQPGTVAAAAPDSAPEPIPTGSDTGGDPALATDPTVMPERTVQPIAGTGAWTTEWQRRFEKLQLAPADVAFLAQANYSDAELTDIANQLGEVDVLDPAAANQQIEGPTPNVDAGSVSSADGPLPEDVVPQGQPGSATGSAWTPQWEQRFGDVMTRMGMSETEIAAQLKGVQSQPTTEAQLSEAYRQMEQSIGAFSPEWRDKFTKVMTDLKTPKAEQEQVLQQLAGSGMDESKLTEAYTQMQNSLPAWNTEWEDKFKSLAIPDEMLKQLKDSGAPKAALEAQFKQLVDTKMKYRDDGRLEKLEDADASNEEKWGVMLQNTEGKDFDKVVEQIPSAHVPMWKRALSFGVNLIPGVYALQYITGKDWVTSEKIDRSNPLNIVGAVASGFAGFTAVRSAVQGIQGLSAASRAATATMQAANASKGITGLAASVESLGSASALSRGSFQAIEAAGLVSKFEKGLKFTDYLKSAVPLVNRFGEAGRLSSVGRGYFQGMQLAAGAASLKALEGGKVGIDAATRSTVLGELKQGRSIQDAMTAAGRSSGTGGGYAIKAQDVIRDSSRYGFLQGGAGKLAEGNKLMRGSGNFRFSPFKNSAAIGTTNTEGVFALGRNVNFGTNGGLAQGLGAIKGANSVQNAGLYAQAAQRATGANQLMNAGNAQRMAGLNIADDVQRIETMTKTAEWAGKLGVTGGSKFRTLLQLGGSNRTAARVAGMVENGGNQGYRAARMTLDTAQRFGNFVATPLVAGAAFGMTGKQMQPLWEYWKNRDEIHAEEQQQAGVADQEAKDLERLYAEQQAGGGTPTGQPNPAGGAAPEGGNAQVQVLGASPSGGQYVLDPSVGLILDTATGDLIDPNTQQLVGNMNQMANGVADSMNANPAANAQSGPTATTGAGGEAGVFVDPQSGMYVDPQTGLKADPKTGQVYDAQNNVVGNINQPAA